MRLTPSLRRLTLGLLLLVLLTACGGNPGGPAGPSLAVGASRHPESILLANLYAAALRAYGTPAHVEVSEDPLAGLDSGAVSVVPGLTGQLLRTFAPPTSARSDEQTYKDMVGVLPEGVAVGDYTTAAEDKPAIAVTAATAKAWGGRDLTALVDNCPKVSVGAVRGARNPDAIGRCTMPAAREFADESALFDALRGGAVTAAWTSTADPDVPADVLVLADGKPALIQAQNVVPLYRRNELTQQQVLALNQVAGVLGDAGQSRSILQRRGADVAAHVVPGDLVGVDPAVLQRPPGQPQRHPLLRVHGDGLTGRDGKEFRVECRCVMQEAAEIVDRGEAVASRTVEQFGEIPAAVGGECSEGLALLAEQCPVAVGVGHPARGLQGHPDDDDRICAPGRHVVLISVATAARCSVR